MAFFFFFSPHKSEKNQTHIPVFQFLLSTVPKTEQENVAYISSEFSI